MSDNTDNDGNESDLIKDLRKQIRTKDQRLKELEPLAEQNVFGQVFDDFGLSPEKGAGKAARAAYDGEMSPDAVREWLTSEMGFEPIENDDGDAEADTKPEGMEQRQQQQNRQRQVRESSQPSTGQTITSQQAGQMAQTGGMSDVLQAQKEGLIERPPAIQALIERNRAENARTPRLG